MEHDYSVDKVFEKIESQAEKREIDNFDENIRIPLEFCGSNDEDQLYEFYTAHERLKFE